MSDSSSAQTAADAAQAALAASQSTKSSVDTQDAASEVAASDQLADTLATLQQVIERNAHEAKRIKEVLKEKRESLRSIFENDAQLAVAQEEADKASQAFKQRKVQVQSSPETVAVQTQLADLKEQLGEIEESLNSHLLNYFQLTNSMSFDTSDGDQWDFVVSAKLKSK